jgi:ATP-binding cassette, subfamily B, bacterial
MSERKFFKPVNNIRKRVRHILEKLQAYRQMALNFKPHARKQYKRLALGFLTGLGYVLAGMLEPWPLKMIFDNVFLDEPLPQSIASFFGRFTESQFAMLYLLIGLIVIIAIERGIFYYYQQLHVSKAGQKIVSGIRQDLYDHLQRLSFSFHDKSKTGDLIARLTTDMRILRDISVSLPLIMITDILSMVAMIAVMAYMDIALTLIALLVIPVLLLLIKKYRLPMKDAMKKQREREGHLNSLASEALGAIKVVQGYHQEDYEVSKFGDENKAVISAVEPPSRNRVKPRSKPMRSCIAVPSSSQVCGSRTPGQVLGKYST